MNMLDKYTTEHTVVSMVEEDGIAVVYAVWSKNYEAITKTLICIPMAKINGWLSTTAADLLIQRKLEQLKTECYRPRYYHRAPALTPIPVFVANEPEDVVVGEEVKGRRTYNITSRTKTFFHIATGEEVTVSNIALFCRERNIPYGSFKKMAQGRNKTSHGWMMV